MVNRCGEPAACSVPESEGCDSGIVTRIRDEVLKAEKIHADDTPVPVLDPGRGKTATGRLWGYAADNRASGGTAPRATWYRFTPDRTAAHHVPSRRVPRFPPGRCLCRL